MASSLPENSAAGVSGDDPGQDEEVRSKPASGERGMSSIIKLYVQGIRGFGAAKGQEAVIEFGKPLTLITGQNGAGKTTIIECLKYITTGELPPNGKSGVFVHDPKLTSERSVRGVVKLKFQDISGNKAICHRMLESAQKLHKLKQTTLDLSLEKVGPDGQKKKITTRCAEINREMIDLLGVSKAILANVIFCHQEESSWPLSEGKALKEKFDEIFASTRYTKALENFKKIQQDLNGEIKVYKAELSHLQKQKDKVDEEQIKTNLKETQKRVDNSKAEITRIISELSPAETRLEELNNKYEEVTRIEKEITKHESSRQELMRSQRQLESRIEEIFTGTKAELHQEKERQQAMVERSSSELEEYERKVKQLTRSMGDMKDRVDGCHKELGRLKTEEQYHKDRVTHRDKQLVATAARLSLSGYEKGPFDQSTVSRFLNEFMQKRKRAEEEASAEKEKLLKKERGLQDQLDSLRTNLAKIEESIQMKSMTVIESRRKMGEIAKELAAIGSGAAALEGVEQELASAEKELSEYRELVDPTSMETELETMTQEKMKLNSKIAQLTKELGQLTQHSVARGAVEELKKQRRSKEETYHLGMESVEPELLSVLGVMPSSGENLVACVEKVVRSKEQEKQAASEKLHQATAQVSRLQTQKEELQKRVAEKKARAEALQQEVSEVCGEESSDSYQEMVDTLQEKIDSATENIATVKGSQSFFRKSLEKLHSNQKCPLCMRGFQKKDDLDKTIHTITMRLNEAIPKMIPRLNTELRELQERQKRLQELKPKIEDLSHIQSQELSQRQRLLEEKGEALNEAQRSIEREKEKQQQLQRELGNLRALQPKVSNVMQLKEQLRELDEKISAEESKLGHLKTGSKRSHHVVNREVQEAQRNVEELNRRMDHKRQEITDIQRTTRQLEDRVHELRENKLRLQGQLQKRETLLSKKKDLTMQVESLDREVKTESNHIGPVKQKLRGVQEEKEEVGRERSEAESKSWAELDGYRISYEELRKYSETISKYLREGKDKAVEECEERAQVITEQMNAKHTEKKELEGRITALTRELANVKNKERDLTDNLLLLTQREEIEQKARKVQDLRRSLQNMGLEAYDDEFQRLQTDTDHLRKEKARAEGHREGLEDQVRHLQRELQSDLYSGIEEQFMDMTIKLKTSETASRDVGKYYKALDQAIVRFHRAKMEDINDIIKELWIKTYKGGDIDTIKISSYDGGTQLSESTTIATKRTYNYMVVMVKGSIELDMRGRCSAGQKVLASIIIRLALAETFCLTSGLLTLDEPTTNLDRENVEGLAQALAEIIKERSKNQKNFQLIIITHDEGFVELLGHTGYADSFFKVTKNVGETSKITKYFF